MRRLVAAAATMAVVLMGGAAWWFGRSASPDLLQAVYPATQEVLRVDSAPTPQNGLVTTDAAGNLVLTWENPAPKAGDTYTWMPLNNDLGSQQQEVGTNRLVLSKDPAVEQICVEIRLVRQTGKVSEPGLRVCE